MKKLEKSRLYPLTSLKPLQQPLPALIAIAVCLILSTSTNVLSHL